MADEEIKKGDVVWLKSGGPAMTVVDVGDYRDSVGPQDGAFCQWFDGKKRMEGTFDRATLTKVDPMAMYAPTIARRP